MSRMYLFVTLLICFAILSVSCGDDSTDNGDGDNNGEEIGLIRTFSEHNSTINSLDLSTDGTKAISAEDGGKIIYWQVTDNKVLKELIYLGGNVYSSVFSPDCTHLISGYSDYMVRYWDINNSTCQEFNISGDVVYTVDISPDAAYGLLGTFRFLKYWTLSDGKEVYSTDAHTGYVRSVKFCSQGIYALTCGDDFAVKYWDLKNKSLLREMNGHTDAVYSVAFSPDGKKGASGSQDGTIKYWDLTNGACTKTFSGHSASVNSIAISKDGLYILSGSNDKTMKLWQIDNASCINTFSSHTDVVTSVSISDDGKHAISGSKDKTVKYWLIRK
ncbi:MAG: WD40 repeat domain-containing protein [Candidatus Coatesbacteria bacterium]|nr:WD40 repeat domain-containing protein [Candidatus Coatesbacteria bacterium]